MRKWQIIRNILLSIGVIAVASYLASLYIDYNNIGYIAVIIWLGAVACIYFYEKGRMDGMDQKDTREIEKRDREERGRESAMGKRGKLE